MAETEFVPRPFAGLPREAAWVALREILPAATMTFTADDGSGPTEITATTALPGLLVAWHRSDGARLIGMQTNFSSSDRSRDVAKAVSAVIAAAKDTEIDAIDVTAPGGRLQDLIQGEPGRLEVQPDYGFLAPADGEASEDVKAAIEQANAMIIPTEALDGTEDAYWTEMSGREYVRWVRTEDEDELFDAMARLHAARELNPVDGAKYAGAFRACGLVIPVWELPRGTGASGVAGPLAGLAGRIEEALAATSELSTKERQARSGLVSRSLTLR